MGPIEENTDRGVCNDSTPKYDIMLTLNFDGVSARKFCFMRQVIIRNGKNCSPVEVIVTGYWYSLANSY